MRKNPIGHTIFLTCEKYHMINQKPDTRFYSQKRKNRIGFSRLSGRPCEVIESECLRRFLLPENQQVKMSHSLCELRTGRAHNVKKPNLSQLSEGVSTTVHSASLVANYQHGQPAMSLFTGAVIQGGQLDISISSLNHRPWPLQKLIEISRNKIHKNVQKAKTIRLRFVVKNALLVCWKIIGASIFINSSIVKRKP